MNIYRAVTDYTRQLFKGMEIVEIYPNLFQSSAIRWPWDEKKIQDLRINVVIDLAGGFDPHMKFLDQYLYWPFEDKDELPDRSLLLNVANFAFHSLGSGKKVLTHCTAGYNRSGLVNAVILMIFLGTSGLHAMEYIRKARPGALYNKTFSEFLEKN